MTHYPQKYLEVTGTDDICLILLAKTKQSIQTQANFATLNQILQTWERFHLVEPSHEGEIQEECIWNNQFITIEHNKIYWPKWSNAGINFVNDLLHETLPRFLSHTELAQKYHITCTFLQTLQIRSALPGAWRKQISHHARPFFLPKLYLQFPSQPRMEILDKSSKFIYYAMLPCKTVSHPSQEKWNRSFPPDLPHSPQYWQSIYKTPYQCLRETKLQSFQLKILYRIIPCNHYLKNIRIRENDLCSYCNCTDSVEHFLFECIKVQQLWSNLSSWIHRELNLEFEVSPKQFFLGVTSPGGNAKVINSMILYFKYYVHRQKLFHNGEMSLVSFLGELKMKLRTERLTCALQNKLHLFNKWNEILGALG